MYENLITNLDKENVNTILQLLGPHVRMTYSDILSKAMKEKNNIKIEIFNILSYLNEPEKIIEHLSKTMARTNTNECIKLIKSLMQINEMNGDNQLTCENFKNYLNNFLNTYPYNNIFKNYTAVMFKDWLFFKQKNLVNDPSNFLETKYHQPSNLLLNSYLDIFSYINLEHELPTLIKVIDKIKIINPNFTNINIDKFLIQSKVLNYTDNFYDDFKKSLQIEKEEIYEFIKISQRILVILDRDKLYSYLKLKNLHVTEKNISEKTALLHEALLKSSHFDLLKHYKSHSANNTISKLDIYTRGMIQREFHFEILPEKLIELNKFTRYIFDQIFIYSSSQITLTEIINIIEKYFSKQDIDKTLENIKLYPTKKRKI